jgi:hypothetical protein
MTIEAGEAGQSGATTTTSDAGAAAPAATTTDAGTAAVTEGAAGSAAPPAAAAYTPNFKFKYVDPEGKDVEGEVDDAFKALVKNAEMEKKVRELYEKSHSLDFIKGGRQKAQQTASQVSAELTELKGGIDQLRKYVQAGDFDSFFEALEIPQQRVMQYALQVAQREKMDPAQRQAYDQHTQQRRQMMQLQEQNQTLQQQYTNAAVQARTVELDGVLSRPEVAATASAFDSRVGRPGAFRAEVIRRGQHAFHTQGSDVPAEALVADMLSTFGPLVSPQAPAGMSGAPAMAAPQAKPTLPNIMGKGTSPAKRVPKNLADLRQMAQQAAEG